jgi:phosphoenolpyruvate synthase/pyruvate phosphate dikinase
MNGKERPDWLRNWILAEVRAHRNKLASTVENATTADASTPIVRLGTGSLGGKGRGFRFLHNLSDKFNMSTVIPDLELVVPRCFILATSCFEDFMEDNQLLMPALEATDNAQLVSLFGQARLRDDVTESLKQFLATERGPLAVRSSSLFEDIYRTVFLPNAADDLDARLEQLTWAVKQVYASTYSIEARAYANSQV